MKKSSRRIRRQAVRKTRRLRGGGGCLGWLCRGNKSVVNEGAIVANPLQQSRVTTTAAALAAAQAAANAAPGNARALRALGRAQAAHNRAVASANAKAARVEASAAAREQRAQESAAARAQREAAAEARRAALVQYRSPAAAAARQAAAEEQKEACRQELLTKINESTGELYTREEVDGMLDPCVDLAGVQELERLTAKMHAAVGENARRSRRGRRNGRKSTRRLRGGGKWAKLLGLNKCFGNTCSVNEGAIGPAPAPGGSVIGASPVVATMNPAGAAGGAPAEAPVMTANPMHTAAALPAAGGVGPSAANETAAAIQQLQTQLESLKAQLIQKVKEKNAAKAKADELRAKGNASGAALYDKRVDIYKNEAIRMINLKSNYILMIQTLQRAEQLRFAKARGAGGR